MSAARDELNAAKKVCMDNSGNVVEVVEYGVAVSALLIQKACMISGIQSLLGKIVLANALGRQENWEEIVDKFFKDY
jgi:hypothetical protein